MSIQKEENNRPFKTQIHQKKRIGQNRQNFGNRDRNRQYSGDKDTTLAQTIGDSHKVDNMDMTVGGEVIDITITSFSNDIYDNRNRSRTRDRDLTPRRNDNRRHDSPNENLGTRK